MKRRQFAKMQKMLLSDERVSKVAENPRNQAFLRTIEDVGSDEDMDFLFAPAPRNNGDDQLSTSTGAAASQENDAHKTVPDSQPRAGAEAVATRRTKNGRRPANIGEIRETLSNLLDEPSGNTVISTTDFGSEGESGSDDDRDSESSNKENNNPRHRRGGAVVDRISLKRQGSSNASNSSTGGGRMAFTAPSASANGGFKVPALLRKATTNSIVSSGSSGNGAAGSNSGGSAGGFGDEAKIKKNAGKRSGISYLARETDRRAKLEEAEKRREAKKFKAVEGRSRFVGGLFGAGKFE